MSPAPVVQEMTLLPKDEARDLAPVPTDGLAMFERLAKDASVDVDKLDRLMQMHERATARFSQEQFNAAMADAMVDSGLDTKIRLQIEVELTDVLHTSRCPDRLVRDALSLYHGRLMAAGKTAGGL